MKDEEMKQNNAQCNCDETCDCGCQEGNPCTCECDDECDCGCQDNNNCDCDCECDDDCDCGCEKDPEIVTFVDDDKNEHMFFKLFEFEVKGVPYAVLQEAMADEENNPDVFIAGVSHDGDNTEYAFISDEKVFNEVTEELQRMLAEEECECEDDCDDDCDCGCKANSADKCDCGCNDCNE